MNKVHWFYRWCNLSIITLSLFCCTTDSFAQLEDKLTLSFDFLNESGLKEPIPGSPSSSLAKWRMFTGSAELSVPAITKYETLGDVQIPTLALINIVSYHSKITQESLFGLSDEHFHGINYTAVFFTRLSPKWYLNVIGGLTVAADDLGEIGGSDIKLQGGLYFDRHTASGWTFGVGAIFSQFTGDNLVIPMIHIAKENQARNVKFELLVPKILFEYKPKPVVTLGLLGELTGNLYTLTDSRTTLFDANGNIVNNNVSVELAFSELNVGPKVNLASRSGLSIELRGGVSTARRFELLAKNEGKTLRFPPGSEGAGEKTDFDLESTAFFKALLGFTF